MQEASGWFYYNHVNLTLKNKLQWIIYMYTWFSLRKCISNKVAYKMSAISSSISASGWNSFPWKLPFHWLNRLVTTSCHWWYRHHANCQSLPFDMHSAACDIVVPCSSHVLSWWFPTLTAPFPGPCSGPIFCPIASHQPAAVATPEGVLGNRCTSWHPFILRQP